MPIKSADWTYSEDENGDVDTSTIDLISPEGGSAGMVRAETDPVTSGIVLIDSSGSTIIRPVESFTWATRPSAAAWLGITIRVTDVGGSAGSLWISDGAYWIPQSGRVVLGHGATSLACTGTSGVQETLATVTMPADMMGPNGRIIISSSLNLTGNNASKELRHYFGALQVMGINEAANANPRSARFVTQIQNRNDTSSQISSTAANNSVVGTFVNVALLTGAIDTQNAVNISISCSRGHSGDTAVLEQFMVELVVP